MCWIGPAEQYLKTFSWNKVKYRADKSLAELIDMLQKVGSSRPRRPNEACTEGLLTAAGYRKSAASITTSAANITNTTRSRRP